MSWIAVGGRGGGGGVLADFKGGSFHVGLLSARGGGADYYRLNLVLKRLLKEAFAIGPLSQCCFIYTSFLRIFTVSF